MAGSEEGIVLLHFCLHGEDREDLLSCCCLLSCTVAKYCFFPFLPTNQSFAEICPLPGVGVHAWSRA